MTTKEHTAQSVAGPPRLGLFFSPLSPPSKRRENNVCLFRIILLLHEGTTRDNAGFSFLSASTRLARIEKKGKSRVKCVVSLDDLSERGSPLGRIDRAIVTQVQCTRSSPLFAVYPPFEISRECRPIVSRRPGHTAVLRSVISINFRRDIFTSFAC